MSPLPLRRYRAERLLREEFAGRREEVLAVVRSRLRAQGVRLDLGDLEGCYAQAWQGLYAALLAGREVANPVGWLTVVTYRRAIDEHRSRARGPARAAGPTPDQHRGPQEVSAPERDLAAELDDRTRLRQLFEGLRGQLSARECEAASLCYLQGLSRSQAAEQMGIGETAMRKLMEGRGPGRPGVAGKVGDLLRAIRGGEWCEQQASLMRGLAFGILDPDGERYRLARIHQRECPACRAYVLSLRGLAAVLPPLALPWGFGVGAGAGAGVGAGSGTGAGAGAGAGGAGGGFGTGSGAAAGSGAGTGVGIGTGASVGGAKLAVSCVLALSVGCVAIVGLPRHSAGAVRRRVSRGEVLAAGTSASRGARAYATAAAAGSAGSSRSQHAASGSEGRSVRHPVTAAHTHARAAVIEPAQREFGPERTTSAAAVRPQTLGSSARLSPATGASTTKRPADGAEKEFGP
jgi:DNA-directed RNA polymerase specialized sigma24 family protein